MEAKLDLIYHFLPRSWVRTGQDVVVTQVIIIPLLDSCILSLTSPSSLWPHRHLSPLLHSLLSSSYCLFVAHHRLWRYAHQRLFFTLALSFNIGSCLSSSFISSLPFSLSSPFLTISSSMTLFFHFFLLVILWFLLIIKIYVVITI